MSRRPPVRMYQRHRRYYVRFRVPGHRREQVMRFEAHSTAVYWFRNLRACALRGFRRAA